MTSSPANSPSWPNGGPADILYAVTSTALFQGAQHASMGHWAVLETHHRGHRQEVDIGAWLTWIGITGLHENSHPAWQAYYLRARRWMGSMVPQTPNNQRWHIGPIWNYAAFLPHVGLQFASQNERLDIFLRPARIKDISATVATERDFVRPRVNADDIRTHVVEWDTPLEEISMAKSIDALIILSQLDNPEPSFWATILACIEAQVASGRNVIWVLQPGDSGTVWPQSVFGPVRQVGKIGDLDGKRCQVFASTQLFDMAMQSLQGLPQWSQP